MSSTDTKRSALIGDEDEGGNEGGERGEGSDTIRGDQVHVSSYGEEDIHQTHYKIQADDDDNTFVDHGSTSASALPSSAAPHASNGDVFSAANRDEGHRTFASLSVPAAPKPPISSAEPIKSAPHPEVFSPSPPHGAPFSFGTAGGEFVYPSSLGGVPGSVAFSYGPANDALWNPPRVVSRMSMDQSVRTMTVAPDGKSLWLAIGDDPLTLLEVDGTDLVVSKSMESVSKVYCVAVVTIPGMQHTRFKSMPVESEVQEVKEDSHFLWCGLNKGHINIVDLQQCADAGYIRAAHSQTLHRIWHLPNGKVWTSGLDKAVKVWDPQTRRKLKNRNIAAILMDLCYVHATKEVWGISEDNAIRVYEGSGDNARVNKQSGDNTLKLKSDLVLIQYCEDSNLVWAGSTKGTSLIDPSTYEVVCHVNVTLSALAFHKKTAIVTGHGPLLECDTDCVSVLDITNPQDPTPLFIGNQMEGVAPIGMHLFTATPLAIVAQDEGRYQEKNLTVFTYEETMPIGKYNPLQRDLPQRRTSGNFRGVPPLLNSMKQNVSAFPAPPPPSSSPPPAGGREDVQQSHAARISGGRAESHGAPLTRQQHLAASPAVIGLLENIAVTSNETRNILATLQRTQAPVLDFGKLQISTAKWAMSQAPGSLPPLNQEELNALERDYTTSEGKALATIVAQLQKVGASRMAPEHLNDGRCPAPRGSGTVGSRDVWDQTLRPPSNLNSTVRFPNAADHTAASSSDDVALHQVTAQLSQAGAADRAIFQHQMQIFQRHNKRLMDRQNALILGFARISQAVRTFAQNVHDDLSERVALSEGKSVESQLWEQQSASLSDALRSSPDISTNSSSNDIQEAVEATAYLLTKASHIQGGMRPAPNSGQEIIAEEDEVSPTHLSAEKGVNEAPAYQFQPGEATRITLESLVLSPTRLLGRIEEELLKVQSFMERAAVAWSRTENIRQVAYTPYEGNRTPDLGRDFTQLVPLMDFQDAKLMLDICRIEGFLAVTESLLDRDDGAVYRALGGKEGGLRETSRQEASEFREKAAKELRALVDVSITLETFSSRVRACVSQIRDNLPPALAEHIQKSCGGFLSFDLPLHTERAKFEGTLYWAHMCCALLCYCFESVESLFWPSEAPVRIENENFALIAQKLFEWENFIKEIERRCGHLEFISTLCRLEHEAVRRHHMDRPASLSLATAGRWEPHDEVFQALRQWKSDSLASGARGAVTAPSPPCAENETGDTNDISLHHIILFLYIHDRLQNSKDSHEEDYAALLGISTASTVQLVEKIKCLTRFNRCLQKRSHELADAAPLSNTLDIPPQQVSPEETLTPQQRALCKRGMEEHK